MSAVAHYKKLVLATAHALYAGTVPTSTGGSERSDTTGVMVVVLSALTRRAWVKEVELANDLKIGQKLVRRAIKVLEGDQLIVREARKDTKKFGGISKEVAAAAEEAMRISKAKALQAMGVAEDKAEEAAAAGAAGADGREKRDTARDTEKSTKNGVFQWIALDYGHFADVVRLKLHTLRAKINAQLDVKKADPELVCQSCGHRTSQLDAFADGLMNPETMVFECPHCSGLLLPDGAKGDAADAHRERAEAMRAALADIDKSLVQVVAALIRVRALPAPLFRSLDEWRRAEAAKRGVVTKRGTPGVSRPLEEGVSGLADINIEVDLGDTPADGRLGGPKRPKRALPAFFQQDHAVKRARPASQQPAGFDGANGGAAAQEPVAAGAVEGKAAPAVPAPVAAVGASKAEEDALDRFYAAEEEAKAQAAAAQAAAAHAQEQPAAAAETAGDGADSDSDDGWEEA